MAAVIMVEAGSGLSTGMYEFTITANGRSIICANNRDQNSEGYGHGVQ